MVYQIKTGTSTFIRKILSCISRIAALVALDVCAKLTPPDQKYYLHFSQGADFRGQDPLQAGEHQTAWVDSWENHGVQSQMTIALWVYWEESDLNELAAATGLNIDRMSLLCGQRAFGFQRGSYGSEGWTFFLQTRDEVVYSTGQIPLPFEEWAHLAASFDGQTIKTYLNGELQHSGG